jgi:hypothetical protein
MTQSRTQQLITKLRESIIDKPPYISGALQLPDSYFSLFYKVAEDGNAARFGPFWNQRVFKFADILIRHINFVNATLDELEQLARAASFDDHKAGTIDSGSFSPILDPFHTDLMEIVRECLLEGTQSAKKIKTEPYKLAVYSTHLIFIYLYSSLTMFLSR